MAWWIWGVVGWTGMTIIVVAILAAVCTRERRHSKVTDPVPEKGWLPGFVDEAPAGAPLAEAADAGPGLPVQRAGGSASLSRGPSTQPLTRLPPGAAGEEVGWPMVPHSVLGHLVEGARAGSYTLPERLVEMHHAGRLLRDLELAAPQHFGREEAATRLVDAAMDSRPLDPMGLCAEMHRSRTDRLLYQEALELLTTAIRRAEDAAVREAAQGCDAIITEHLRPAYREVLHRARAVARRLGPYIDDRFQLDTPRVITANRKVRNAYLALPGLVRQHSRILAARQWANSIAGRAPQWDRRGLFSVFENPFAVTAASGLPYDDIPVPPLPLGDTARLVWLVSDEADAGKPWLPSVEEQDAAWRHRFARPLQGARPQQAEADAAADRA